MATATRTRFSSSYAPKHVTWPRAATETLERAEVLSHCAGTRHGEGCEVDTAD